MSETKDKTTPPENDTPMLRQYYEMKRRYPGMLLMFRLGDFYELFEEDARTVSKLLGLTLTHRVNMPMCGVPYHSAESYINRLVAMRCRVAVCDQMEDPKKAKGLVKREVTRIVTPSTNLDDNRRDAKANSFLAAAMELKARGRETYGLAFLDISTGDFAMTELDSRKEVAEELVRLQAREILIPEEQEESWREVRESCGEVLFVTVPSLYFDDGCNVLLSHFKVGTLSGFGCDGHYAGTMCAGAALRYIRENFTQASLDYIGGLRVYNRSGFMQVSEHTRRNLELTRSMRDGTAEGSLLSVLDETQTPMGGRLLRSWILAPLLDKCAIEARYDAIETLMGRQGELTAINEGLDSFGDLEKLVSRLSTGYGTPRDLLGLRNSLHRLPLLVEQLEKVSAAAAAAELLPRPEGETLLGQVRADLKTLPDLAELLDRALSDTPPLKIQDGGIIKDGFNAELDDARSMASNGKEYIAGLQLRESERTGIKNLKFGFNKIFGYYIEVTKPNLHLVPEDYIRKQTVVNGERFITPELKELESKILHAEERALELELELFQQLRQAVMERHETIQRTASAVAKLDVLQNLAWIALRRNYCRPVIREDDVLDIRGGRHPVVERLLPDRRFVPNDTLLDTDDHQIILLTGPNMAGKSTYIRQVALLTLLAQSGSFIPADSATIGLTDQIFTRVGASDELSRGQSTFMVEMTETANILHNATRRSLVILDEIGRGTSTYDGLAIAWAVLDYLNTESRVKARTLFATHYHELIQLEDMMHGVLNYNVAVREDGASVSFLHEIRRGGTDRSYGIHVAKLAGLPQPVVDRATSILERLEEKPNELKLSYVAPATRPEAPPQPAPAPAPEPEPAPEPQPAPAPEPEQEKIVAVGGEVTYPSLAEPWPGQEAGLAAEPEMEYSAPAAPAEKAPPEEGEGATQLELF